MHIVHPTQEQVDALQSMRFHHPCPAVQRRAEIVLLAAHCVAYGKIAGILGVCPNTVTNTLVAFESGGIEGLALRRASGTDCEPAAFDSLMREHWSEHPPGTVKEAAVQLEEIAGVKRGLMAVRDYMKRLGLKRRKTGSVPGKAVPEKQRLFVGEIIEPCMSAAEGGEGVVYFRDASHFVFGAFLGYVWCFFRVFIPTSPGRQRYNVLGTVDVIGGALLTVFLDNARYQRCSLVMAKARELGIELSFLPSYSPNLNLIERFWKYVKKTCLTNRSFSDFSQFRAAIDSCIEDAFRNHAEELKTLMAPKFQIIEFSQSLAA